MSPQLKIAVAEDDALHLECLIRVLEKFGCEVVASFGNGLELEEWMATSPAVDALFLDVQMPGMDGLSLRASLDPKLPVVFVTAHAENAVGAFDLDAVDFLLKPVNTSRLVQALAKVRRALGREEGAQTPGGARNTRYSVMAGGGMLFLELAKTSFFEVGDQGVWAFSGERFRTKFKTLGEVEAFFPEAGLLRIHRHLLIRPEAVLGLRSTGGGNRVLVRMVGGVELEASRGTTPELKKRLGVE